MKSLINYINESKQLFKKDITSLKTISLDFTGLDEGSDIKEEVVNICGELGLSIENDEELSLDIILTPQSIDKISELENVLKSYVSKIRSSAKRTNNESYALLTKKFKKSVEEIDKYKKEVLNINKKNNDEE